MGRADGRAVRRRRRGAAALVAGCGHHRRARPLRDHRGHPRGVLDGAAAGVRGAAGTGRGADRPVRVATLDRRGFADHGRRADDVRRGLDAAGGVRGPGGARRRRRADVHQRDAAGARRGSRPSAARSSRPRPGRSTSSASCCRRWASPRCSPRPGGRPSFLVAAAVSVGVRGAGAGPAARLAARPPAARPPRRRARHGRPRGPRGVGGAGHPARVLAGVHDPVHGHDVRRDVGLPVPDAWVRGSPPARPGS